MSHMRFSENMTKSLAGRIYRPAEVDLFVRDAVGFIPQAVRRKDKPALLNYPAAFDTEFSSFQIAGEDGFDKSVGTVYLWGFGLNGLVTVGRTISEFIDFLGTVQQLLYCGEHQQLRVYCHNLGVEFQFLRRWFDWSNVFAREERKPLSAVTSGGIEFRDSLALTGMSLDAWGKSLIKYKVTKASGDLDYHLMRNDKTPISDTEMGYMVRDILVPMAGIMEKMMQESGRLDRVPMTKTGYARRTCRKNCLSPAPDYTPEDDKEARKAKRKSAAAKGSAYRRMIHQLTMTPEEFKLAFDAFAGGFTHANSCYVPNVVPETDVDSYDFASSYPAQMVMSAEFPISKGIKLPIERYTLNQVMHLIRSHWCMFRVGFDGLRPIISQDNYLSVSKCKNVSGAVVNNGRLVSASHAETTVTSIDWDVIQRCYTWDKLYFGNFWMYRKGYLPKPIIETVLQLYHAKSVLKGVPGKELEYSLSKEQLNSLYGMMVMRPISAEVTYSADGTWGRGDIDVSALVDKYNEDPKRFTSYLWGITITALARRAIWGGILECGEDYMYSDTDSLKILHGDVHRDYVLRYNEYVNKCMERAAERVGFDVALTRPITPDGQQKFLGHYDYEGRYRYFKSKGAKRYMTLSGDVMSLTISGVNKTTAVPYLCQVSGVDFTPDAKRRGVCHLNNPEDALKIFAMFEDGMVVPGEYVNASGDVVSGSGKLLHVYNDEECSGVLVDYLGNAAEYHELSSMSLYPTSYTMSMADEFVQFCLGIRDFLK